VLGCEGVFAGDRDALADALETSFTADRPTLIHVEAD
jgi:thiamine pyrophosphate-dependent acetolactate synthase large subunit-like protein